MNWDLKKALKLYVVLDRKLGAPRSLEEQAGEAIEGGATMIQLRDKELGGRELYEAALNLSALCRRAGAVFIVNDRLDIALASGADGVHLGAEDLPVRAARSLVPGGFIIGASAHSVEEARVAEAEGAHYAGIGAVFPTGTKGSAVVIGLGGLREIRSALSIPAVAIGGISEDNAEDVMAAGADGIAVASAVVAREDIAGAAARLAQKLKI
ncbi:MAG: thiamine phosphate synthase [Synergistaceae bacterium]|nr:thiamine phosphate synthase [Synergistaceae bacterium]